MEKHCGNDLVLQEVVVYWSESMLLRGADVLDVALLEDWIVVARLTLLESQERMVLAHVTITEDALGQRAYTSLTLFALHPAKDERQALLGLLPLDELTPQEQQHLRTWLITQHWQSWARAEIAVRSRLGVHEPLITLTEAAKQTMVPMPTLQTAAAQDRLPTIEVAGRHLVYVTTIAEAYERGHLHFVRGRPRR